MTNDHEDSGCLADRNVRREPAEIETTALKLFAAGEFEQALRTVHDYLEVASGELTALARLHLCRLQFEIAEEVSGTAKTQAAREWMEAIAEAGNNAWLVLKEPEIRARLDAVFTEPRDVLEWLEFLSFAPNSLDLSQEAIAFIEDFGYRHATEPQLARESERVLHAAGARDAAYRVERARRGYTEQSDKPEPQRSENDLLKLTGLTIAVAGGHPALRRAIQIDLKRAGAKEIREIPPRWEGSRQGREIVALLAGADMVVLIGRHIAHSTVNQVKRGAALAGIPVLASLTANTSGVRRTLMEHRAIRRLDKHSRPT